MFKTIFARGVGAFVVAATVTTLVSCGDDNARKKSKPTVLAEAKPTSPIPLSAFELNLSQTTLPPFVLTSGLSVAEPWGRWSDANQVVFKFGSNLPAKFMLAISAKAYGPNAGLSIPVKVGSQVMEMKLSGEVVQEFRLEFSPNKAADSVEIEVPKPTVPNNGDIRSLGIAFTSIKISPLQ